VNNVIILFVPIYVVANSLDYILYYPCHFCHWLTSLLHSNAGHVSVLKWLNAKGDISLTDRLGGTPLHDAAEQGQFEVGTVQPRNNKQSTTGCK